MKKLHSKKRNKIIVLILAVIMLCNFIMPNCVYANTDTDGGGSIFDPIAKFLTFLCDSFFQFMQETFVSMQSIQNSDGTYNFQYSPAKIFSGKVPAFDANFVSPNEISELHGDYSYFVKEKAELWREELPKFEAYKGMNVIPQGNMDLNYNIEDNKTFEEAINKHPERRLITGSSILNIKGSYWVYYWIEEDTIRIEGKFKYGIFGNTYYYGEAIKIDDSIPKELINTVEYKSVAKKLQNTIVSWYKALRKIALVGLLSALLYVGIKIVISSISEKDASKYKKMLTDWLVAICLLFTLHYLMNFIIIITSKLTEILSPNTLTDPLLNDLRYKIYMSNSWGEQIGKVIIYIVLTIYTITFTFQYVKRVIYLAFFTMIAPLISLTYPIDKISDGKAQAFSFWLREYIFNSFIPVIHLLIYIVLVSSAQDLAVAFPLYAVLAIGFLTKAEQLIRRMFGLDNSETVGFLQTAATGGLIATALSKMKKIPMPKGAKGGSTSGGGSTKGVRTAEKDPLEGLRTARSQGGSGAGGNGNSSQAARASEEAVRRISSAAEAENNSASGETAKKDEKDNMHFWKGVTSLAGKYTGPALSKLVGLGLGGAGTLIGFSAGVAQGDIGKALTGAVAGGSAGYHGGQKLVNSGLNALDSAGHIKDKLHNIEDTFNEGARGKDYVQSARYDREFFASEGYKKLMEEHPNAAQEDIEKMLEAGITDQNSMDKILQNSNGNIEEEIGFYALSKDCDNSLFYGDKGKLGEYIAAKLKVDNIDEQTVDNFYNRMKKYR